MSDIDNVSVTGDGFSHSEHKNGESVPNGDALDMNQPVQPTIEVDPVQLQFELQQRLRQLKVENNIMFLILHKVIYKINLDDPAVIKQYQFAQDSYITNSWLSPNGQHFVVQVNNNVYYYLHDSYDKFKILPRFRNYEVDVIVFPDYEQDSDGGNVNTGEFFVVTKDNTVYVSNLKSHFGQENKKDDKYLKQVYKQDDKILGICLSNNNSTIELLTNHCVLKWDCFEMSLVELTKVFKADAHITDLKIRTELIAETTKDKYVMLSPSTNEIVSNDSELVLSQLAKLNPLKKLSNHPNSLIITSHHLLALSSDHKFLIMFSKLSNHPPSQIELPEKVIGIKADYKSYTFWGYSKNSIYELLISNESVNVWHDYYKMGKYQEALQILDAEPDSHFKRDMVIIKRGYSNLQKGAFGMSFDRFDTDLLNLQIKGIRDLAESSEPFEKICLMLINLQTKESQLDEFASQMLLIEYLLIKYNYVKSHDKNKIKMIILSSWLIELMLRNLNALEDGSIQDNGSSVSVASLSKQMDTFLSSNYKEFDKPTIYQLMGHLNSSDKLMSYAELNKDYMFILNHYIELQDWSSSLKMLIKMYSSNDPEFMDALLKTSSQLLLHYPKETVETWLKFNNINYEKLLPSLLVYNKNTKGPIADNHGIQLLQKIIYNKNVKSKSVNNYYLSFLITHEPKEDEKTYVSKHILKLLNFIKLDSKLYDSGFILRLCLERNHTKAAILILITDLRSFDLALNLAIDGKLTDLALQVLEKFNKDIEAEDHDLDTEFRDRNFVNISKNKLHHKDYPRGKKLWLTFAKYLIDGVVNGEKFEILNDVEDDELLSDDESIENNGSHGANGSNGSNGSNGVNSSNGSNGGSDVVKDLTKDIVDSVSSANGHYIDSKDASNALRYLLDSSFNQTINASFLNLKDLLELFPETIMVNNFKDEIIRSLNQYNNKINQLSSEMKESLVISNKLNSQIIESNDQINQGKIFTIVEPGEPCKLCDKLLINKNFVVFPNCHHNYHKECLIKYYLIVKNDYRFKMMFETFKRTNGGNKKELDAIMLKECVLCNESNLLNIDNNLIDPKDKLIEEWVL